MRSLTASWILIILVIIKYIGFLSPEAIALGPNFESVGISRPSECKCPSLFKKGGRTCLITSGKKMNTRFYLIYWGFKDFFARTEVTFLSYVTRMNLSQKSVARVCLYSYHIPYGNHGITIIFYSTTI